MDHVGLEHPGAMTTMKKCRKFSVCDGSDMQKIGVLGAMYHEMHHKF